MAKELHREIITLKNEVSKMAHFALNMLNDSIDSLYDQDIQLASEVLNKKDIIRSYDNNIEEKALKLIVLHQPMAVDLRTLAAILKIITYLHRIGRYGKDIADVVEKHLSDKPIALNLVNLRHIYEHVKSMIEDAILAFEKLDISLIKDFAARDDEVDKLRWSIFRECLTYMIEDPKYITQCAHYMMFARYLERCGDHACKIAEKVHYMVTGKHIEIS
jgi:phosphate transport system protein